MRFSTVPEAAPADRPYPPVLGSPPGQVSAPSQWAATPGQWAPSHNVPPGDTSPLLTAFSTITQGQTYSPNGQAMQGFTSSSTQQQHNMLLAGQALPRRLATIPSPHVQSLSNSAGMQSLPGSHIQGVPGIHLQAVPSPHTQAVPNPHTSVSPAPSRVIPASPFAGNERVCIGMIDVGIVALRGLPPQLLYTPSAPGAARAQREPRLREDELRVEAAMEDVQLQTTPVQWPGISAFWARRGTRPAYLHPPDPVREVAVRYNWSSEGNAWFRS